MRDESWQTFPLMAIQAGGLISVVRKPEEQRDPDGVDEHVVTMSVSTSSGAAQVDLTWDEVQEFVWCMLGSKDVDRIAREWVRQNYSPSDIWDAAEEG